MLRNRLITVLTFNDGTLFRTKLFEPDYRYTHNFVDSSCRLPSAAAFAPWTMRGR